MKKMAKIAAMLATLALLFGAIGCSNDGDDDSPHPDYGDYTPPLIDDNGYNEQDSENIEYDHSIWDIEYGSVTKYKGREEDVKIPDGVKDITDYAFKDCITVKSVTIPKSVTGIRYYAFWGCDSIEGVYYRGTKEEWKKIDIEDSNTGKSYDYVRLTNEGAQIWCYNADLGIYEIFQEYAYGMWL